MLIATAHQADEALVGLQPQKRAAPVGADDVQLSDGGGFHEKALDLSNAAQAVKLLPAG